MTNSIKMLLCFFLLGVALPNIHAQINVIKAGSGSFTPEELISNVFLGEGVTVTNITYKGDARQVGYFSGATGNIGLDRGIVMSTGQAEGVVGEAGPQSGSPVSSTAMGTGLSDPDLVKLANEIQPGSGVNDVAVYEITFIPVADTLRFRYVFTSEEYPEYVCTDFNDVFGFFISGPGLSGAYSNNSMNIALVPDASDPTGYTFTNQPVAIGSVNNGNPGDNACPQTNANFYNSNVGSLTFAYDAYTDVFTVQAIVTPCQEYHIKLAIADLGDDILDTGVFLEAKSFGTGSVVSDLKTVSVDGTIVEGCSGAKINFSTPNPLADDLTLAYTIIGNATYNTDYTISKDGNSFTPSDPLIIKAGDTTVALDISAIADGLAENGEAVGITIQKDVCTLDTLYIPIKDNILVNPQLGMDTSICTSNGTQILQLNGDLGLPEPEAPTFTYTGNDEISNILPNVRAEVNVIGVQPPFLEEGVIRSVCVKIDHRYNSDLDLFLLSPNNTPIELSTDNGENTRNMEVCFTPTGPNVTTILDTLKVIFPPNGQVNDFTLINNLYFKGNFSPEGNFSDFWSSGAKTKTNGSWKLLVYDDLGFTATQDPATGFLKEWSITFEPLFKLKYEWDATTDLSCLDCPDPELTLPNQTTTYHLLVSDSYGCTVEDEITVFVQDSLDAPTVDCQIVGKDNITFAWTSVAGASGYEINIDGAGWQAVGTDLSFVVTGLAVNQTVSIQVRATGNCPAKITIQECTTLDCIEPQYTEVSTPVNCNGSSDGKFELTLTTQPQAPYTFELASTTNSTGLFTGLAAGDYQIIISDAIGCTFPYDFTIEEPVALMAVGNETQMVNCFGDATGAGAIVLTGGNYPFTFSLNGQTDSTLTQIAAGTYPYVVTDAKGCTASGDLIITENEEITFENMPLDPNCFDSSDGQITIFNLKGGVPTYSFAWNDDQNQSLIAATNLSAGTYEVTVTDNAGCTATASNITLTSPTEISATVEKVDAVCGGDPGSAIITATGGAGTYTYNWSDIGAGPEKRTSLLADAYKVTITDMSGCSTIINIDILSASDIVLKTTSEDIDCFGNDNGSASVNVESGGNAPFSFQWDDAMAQTAKTATNLAKGLYKVIVTDASNCVQIGTAEILEPTELKVDTTIQHIDCFGASTGNITTMVTGGTQPYVYTYTLPDNTTASTENLENIPAGTYQFNVTDAHDCQVNLLIIINQPAPVVLSFDNSDPICFGATDGFTKVEVTGGTMPYAYKWSNAKTTQSIDNLAANTYSVTVTDNAGCAYDAETTITQHEEITASLTQTAALCHDETTGKASAQEIMIGGVTQNKSNFNFTWNTTPSQNNLEATQLKGGATYEVTIEDKTTGCTTTQSIEIDNPDALSGKTLSTTEVTCLGRQDGQAEIVGVGGTPAYTYRWNMAANNQTGATATNLAKGSYRVIIKDAKGCESEIDVEITEPDAIEVAFEKDDVKCSGEATGKISATVNGGTAPYTLLWNDGHTTTNLTGVVAGDYTLTVTDSRGCTNVQNERIIEPGEPLLGSSSLKNVTCNGGRDGQIIIDATGGTAPYQYSLNGEAFSPIGNKVGLYPGSYEVFVQDSRGCLDTLPVEEIFEPNAIEIDLGPNLNINYGDTVQLSADIQNSVGSVYYDWTSGTGGSMSCMDCPTPFVFPSFQEYFYLMVTDEAGCSSNSKILFNVFKSTKIFVPTGFSPNNDGNNDVLYVVGEADVVIESFSIFDRWGENIFQVSDFPINDRTEGWDGTFRGQQMPTGQYAWQLKAIMPDGHTEILQGMSTLIR